MMAALYAFLAWAVYTLWRDLRLHAQSISLQQIPTLVLTPLDADEVDTVTFSKQEVFIGRDPGCTYPVRNETVSSRHARLSYRHNQWWIEDLNSKNGTYLNGERLSTEAVIVPGDEISCGQVSFRVDILSKKSA